MKASPASPKVAPAEVAGRKLSPKAIAVAIQKRSESLIAGDQLVFDGKAPKRIDVVRQFEIKSVRPFTWSALQLKDGTFVIRQVLTGGFVPSRPGDGSYTQPMPIPNDGPPAGARG